MQEQTGGVSSVIATLTCAGQWRGCNLYIERIMIFFKCRLQGLYGQCGKNGPTYGAEQHAVRAARFAHVQDMDEAATSLVFRLGMGMRLQSQPAMRLAISRLIEERVANVVGIEEVRRWLLIIGEA